MYKKNVLLVGLSLILLLFFCSETMAQRRISGKVFSDKNTPLAGASVTVKGNAKMGTQTNAEGVFQFSVPPKTKSLIISFVGYNSKSITIGSADSISVELSEIAGRLDTLVVIGYANQNRKNVTGAISSVSGEAIKNLPAQNVAELLQGRMAGVEVVKESAEPGSKSAQVTIRGVSSLNQPDPLYVIDGVIQKNNGGANINSQDIASIDVLKDASAASIYGASAAGGVIIITTKKGTAGPKPTINFNARHGVTTPVVYKLLNKQDFLKFKGFTDPKGYYSGLTQTQLNALPDFDWVNALYSNGVEDNYNLSVSGKTPTIDYFMSGIHNENKGIFLENNSVYNAFRINADVKISPKIKIGEQLNLSQRMTHPIKTSIVSDPFRTTPTAQPNTSNPQFPWSDFPGGYQGVNVMAQIKTARVDAPEFNMQGNTFIEIKLPPKYMTFKATFGYTQSSWQSNALYGPYSTSASQNLTNSLHRSNGIWEQMMNSYILSYDHTFGGIHTINVMLGYENYKNQSSNLQTSASSVAGSSYGYILTSSSSLNVAGGYDANGLVRSVFGRFNYDFDKKFFATFSVRNDANYTAFGPSNRQGIFPSFSTGWKLHEERFFRRLFPFFGEFKLRGGNGSFGNSNIGSYSYLTTFAVAGAQNFNNGGTPILGYTQDQIANKNIKWETLNETNIGVDGNAFNGKLTFSIDWYAKNTKDMLYWVPIPQSAGLPSRYQQIDGVWYQYPAAILNNIGKVENRGIDLMIGYKNRVKELNYSITFTGSVNKNKVVSLDGAGDAPILNYGANSNYPGTDNSLWVNQPLSYTATGLPFGQFYGYKVLKMFNTNEEAAKYHAVQPNAMAGDLQFWDKDGDGKITDNDKTVIGNPYPKFTYGINGTLNWKDFDVSFLFNGVMGVDIYNGVEPYTMSVYDGGNVTNKVFGTSFLGTNGLTDKPRIGMMNNGVFVRDPNGNYSNASSYFVENGAYLKLKNLQIGYTFRNKLLRKIQAKSARVYVMGNNLFVITKYSGVDPEIGGGVIARGIDRISKYPNARIFSMGVDISF